MKRVLKITATNGGTTAKVRIEVVCSRGRPPFFSTRNLSRTVLSAIADGVMETIKTTSLFWVPLNKQRVGR